MSPFHGKPDSGGIPSLAPREEPDYTTCPFCTMQMRSDEKICPHCHSPNPAARDFRDLLAVPPRYPRLKAFLAVNWQPLALGGAILFAFLVTAVVYYGWIGHRVAVTPNPAFDVKVKQGIEDGKVVLEGSIRNLGEDIPDLSLKSIRLTATFGLEGGGQRVESVFPRVPHRGEGAMLHGETGTFRIAVPEDRVENASLAAEVIDLTCGQPSQRCDVPGPAPRVRKLVR